MTEDNPDNVALSRSVNDLMDWVISAELHDSDLNLAVFILVVASKNASKSSNLKGVSFDITQDIGDDIDGEERKLVDQFADQVNKDINQREIDLQKAFSAMQPFLSDAPDNPVSYFQRPKLAQLLKAVADNVTNFGLLLPEDYFCKLNTSISSNSPRTR